MKALVLCGGIPQIALIQELKSRGITTLLADMNENVVARAYADEFYKVSVLDVDGSVLAVSQFTLCANTSRGRRPDFFGAARPEVAQPLFDIFAEELRKAGVNNVQTGQFGADMQVSLTNDGPVTMLMDSTKLF